MYFQTMIKPIFNFLLEETVKSPSDKILRRILAFKKSLISFENNVLFIEEAINSFLGNDKVSILQPITLQCRVYLSPWMWVAALVSLSYRGTFLGSSELKNVARAQIHSKKVIISDTHWMTL